MIRKNFTHRLVAGFSCVNGKKQCIFYDAKTPGLGLRVTSTNKKSYIFETKLHGKTLRITIGDTKVWTISKAQAEAARLKVLTDQGLDPRQQAKDQRAMIEAEQAKERIKSTLVSDAWTSYLAYQQEKMMRSYIERGKKWGARHLTDHVNLSQSGGEKKTRGNGLTKPGVLFPLMQMRLSDISTETLTQWLKIEAGIRPNNARQGFEMFRTFWRWCGSHPEYTIVIDAQAVESKELRDEVPSRKSKKFDVLDRGCLIAWFDAVRNIHNPVISAYLQVLLLTGARREEMANLRWQDVNFQLCCLWTKDKINEEGRKIPLTPYVAHLLNNLPRRNQWVFSSPAAASGRLAEPRIAHNRALDVAGVPMVTLHGLRRTFASQAEWVEIPAGIVAQIMGHAPSATAEKHYINRPLELLAKWHEKIEAWILEQAGIEFTPTQTGLKVVAQ